MTLDDNEMTFLEFIAQIDVISPEQFVELSQLAMDENELLNHILDKKIIIRSYLKSLRQQFQSVPYVDLLEFSFDQHLVQSLSREQSAKHNVILLDKDDLGYRLAMKNPFDYQTIELLSSSLQSYLSPVLAKDMMIQRSINLNYTFFNTVDSLVNYMEKTTANDGLSRYDNFLFESQKENKPLLLLKAVFNEAISHSASDIHIETDETHLRIRIRIDGDLNEHLIDRPDIGEQIFQTLKILANIDITERYLPQDGGFQFQMENCKIHIRLSIFHIHNGQSAVLRILGHANSFNTLDDILTDDRTKHLIRSFLQSQEGLLLVTGATGSGKTTTLYTCLKEINSKKVKIISIEDPIELIIPRINQIQINPDKGYSFSSSLRHALRQDPDVLLVGEIRDEDTAKIALRAANTGHKVLSTIHARNTISTIFRLIDLNLPGYLIATSAELILSQKLLRCICPYCKIDAELTESDIQQLSTLTQHTITSQEYRCKRGQGCSFCDDTGSHGSVAVVEALAINPAMKEAISSNNFDEFSALATKELHGHRMQDKILAMLKSQMISIEEAIEKLS